MFEKLSKRHDRQWIENQLRVRTIRKQRLSHGNDPLDLNVIFDETVLTRPIGDVKAQLRHLVELAELPTVCLQVLPLSASPHVDMDGSFSVLGFTEADEPDIAHIEHVFGSLQIEKTEEVAACKLAFNTLRTEALTPVDSARLIEQVLARL